MSESAQPTLPTRFDPAPTVASGVEVLERMRDAYVAFDSALRYVAVNAAAERSMQRSRGELLGLTLTAAFPSAVGSESERQYRRVAATGVEAHFTEHYIGDGLDNYVEVDAYPVGAGPAGGEPASDGPPYGVAVFWREVNERVRGAQALHSANVALAERNAQLEAQVEAAERARGAVAAANAQLQATALEVELSNQQLQEQAAELEATTEELQATAARLAEQIEAGERGRAELASSEATLRSFTESAPVLMGLVELLPNAAPDGGDDLLHLYDNPATERFFGAPPGTPPGTPPGATAGQRATTLGASRAVRDVWGRAYREAGERGAPVHFEYAYGSDASDPPDGARWLAVTVAPVTVTSAGASGRRFSYVAEEVTARRRAEAALEAERVLLQATLDQMPVGVSVAEAPSGRVVYTNPAGRRLLGHAGLHALRPAPDRAGDPAYGALHDDGAPYATAEYPLVRALGGECTDQRVLRYRRGDSRETHLAVSAAPVYEAGDDGVPGRLVRAVATWTDVGERVALEEALRRARDAAEAANRAKAEFLANMSHELRTPLNAIGGYTQLIELGIHGPLTDEQRAALGRVQHAQRRLLALINDILNYAKLEAGRVEYDVRAVDVREVVAEVAPLVEPQIAAKGLAFDVRLPETSCLAWADREKLGQVLVNLLSNAAKFTEARHPDTGAPGRVTVALVARESAPPVDGSDEAAENPAEPRPAEPPSEPHVFVRVTDTGRGIPREQQARIFEPFVQVRPAAGSAYARAVEGTGLGLAISRDLARGMGGDLRVRSREGAGATFTVALRPAVDAGGVRADRRAGRERRAEERQGQVPRRQDASSADGARPAGGGPARPTPLPNVTA